VHGELPETRYVAVGDADVAYQVVGDGPLHLLCCYGMGSQIDLLWDLSRSPAKFFSSFARTIQFDRRGTGMSDGVPRRGLATWEEWADDLGAVLEAAGCERAAVYAEVDAGPIALLFAVTRPERVSALVLVNTSARLLVDDDYPIGVSWDRFDRSVALAESSWGLRSLVEMAFPSAAEDAENLRLFMRMQRAALTPRTVATQMRYMAQHVDVREVLPLVRAPTLVLHNNPNPFYPISHAHYLVNAIEGARLVEIPSGGDLNVANDTMMRAVADEVAAFLTGERPQVETDRVLTTVLFTDIVGSTERLTALGDRRWRELLDRHDRLVRQQLLQFRGREVNTTGDGFLMAFDGPARAIRCGRAIIETGGRLGLEVRAGIHTGECEMREDDLAGLAVHIAARVSSIAGSRELLVTNTVKELVAGSNIAFDDRGLHTLKGIADDWRLHAVVDT